MNDLIKTIGLFVLLYPLAMSLIWLIGTLWHYFSREKKLHYSMKEQPFVSVLIPAYNEMETIHNAIEHMHHVNYKNYEIIVINDGSTDRTADVVRGLLDQYPRLRFIDSKNNQGKAKSLRLGAIAAKGEFLVCVDSDAYLDEDGIIHLIAPMLLENNGYTIGAVTGNPRVRNRTNTLAKIQTAEFSSIIGMIKRTQQMFDVCNTVSGVCVAFRKQALFEVDFWDEDMSTEDIAVTWKLHATSWQIVYAPHAICWMLVPETFSGLQAQRLRWAVGGIEVLQRHFWKTIKQRNYRGMVLLFEQIIGIVWAISVLVTAPIILFLTIAGRYDFLTLQTKIIFFICLINFCVAYLVDQKYDKEMFKTYFWVIWYPLAYWIFNVYIMNRAVIYKIFKARKIKKRERAVWDSPDRGEVHDLGLFESDVMFRRASIRALLITVPITIITWGVAGYYIFDKIYKIATDVFINGNTFVGAIINTYNLFFVNFILLVIMIGTVILYFVRIVASFPKKELDTFALKFNEFENETLGTNLVQKYKISSEIIVEEDDEINSI